jgi:hypothetical protein
MVGLGEGGTKQGQSSPRIMKPVRKYRIVIIALRALLVCWTCFIGSLQRLSFLRSK